MKFWKWLDGKKRTIAEIYWFVCGTIILIWFPNGLTGVPLKLQLTIGATLSFIGLGHAVFKKGIADKKSDTQPET